eukprot:Anaeramoba_ignava/a482504_22.p4 GENE.a482504_22~~a482504_22.p4  ORF type:complete len:144 (+),score=11.40 a482504_22:2655-3086(+)
MGNYISTYKIKKIIGRKLKKYWSNTKKTYAGFSDSSLYLPSEEEIEEFIRNNPIQPAYDLGEGFDCDDFSFTFKGQISLYGRYRQLEHSLCVGIAWGFFEWRNGIHATNWVLCDNNKFYWIEPQDGKIYSIDECKGQLRFIIV